MKVYNVLISGNSAKKRKYHKYDGSYPEIDFKLTKINGEERL